MDASRPGARGRARARSRATPFPGQPAPETSSPSPPQSSSPGAPEGSVAEAYAQTYEARRLSDGSNNGEGNGGNGSSSSNGNGSNGEDNGNGSNGEDNGGNGNGKNGNGRRGRGSPYDGRGGTPRGMGPVAEMSYGTDFVVSKPKDPNFTKTVPITNQPVVTVATNYYKFNKHPGWELTLYSVKLEPSADEVWKIRRVIAAHKDNIGSYMLTGQQLFTTRPIPEKHLVYNTTIEDRVTNETSSFQVTLEFHRVVMEGEPIVIQFYNTVVREVLRKMNYKILGRHYFDPTQKVDFTSWRLSLWPGFQNSIRQQDDGLMMNVECVWKVLQTDSILHLMTDLRRKNPSQFEQQCNEAIKGMVVVTIYNAKAYKITRIDYQATPESTFPKADGTSVSYNDYYRDRYNFKAPFQKQPMLVSEPKERDRRRGQTGDIYLVPELCYPCGLNDTLRSNFRLMKDLASCLHMQPTERVNTMNKFVEGATKNIDIMTTLRNWGMKINNPRPYEMTARMLSPDQIVMADGATIKPDDKADWTMGLRGKKMLSVMRLQNWAIVVTTRDNPSIGNLISTMQKVATPLGYNISKPKIKMVADARALPQGVTDVVNESGGRIDMVMIILANNNADTYAAVKKRCSIDFGIPSQCFLSKNVVSKGLMSIATKVVIQMNAKQGGEPWGVKNPLKDQNLMVLGYDVHHAGIGGGQSIGAMTATITPSLGKYYSCVNKAPIARTEVATSVASLFEKCLDAYQKQNGIYPERIIMYRDGVGEGQLKDVYDLEISAFRQKMDEKYKGKQDLPKLAFIVVNKRISTRFFVKVGVDKYDNPKPGLVVDSGVTRPERYDFFLVAPTARQGCVSPTYYNVLVDELQMPPDKMQRFSFRLCHMYYNWSGTVAVPAPCQNAHKLAFLVGTALKRPANGALDNLLHFL